MERQRASKNGSIHTNLASKTFRHLRKIHLLRQQILFSFCTTLDGFGLAFAKLRVEFTPAKNIKLQTPWMGYHIEKNIA